MIPPLLPILPLLACMAVLSAGEVPPVDNPASTGAPAVGEAVPEVPFWASRQLQGDPLFFVKALEAPAATALLLHVPEQAPVIRSATLGFTYVDGVDYEWKPGTRTVVLKEGSRIPFKTAAELHPAPETPNSYRQARDGGSWMLYGEGRYFHDLQAVASYSTRDVWKGPVPGAAPPEQLEKVRARLRAGQPVKVVTLGDSISTGANASGSSGAPPLQPGYPDLVVTGLGRGSRSAVTGKNLSVDGMDSAWGLQQVPAVLAEVPDLVILAFGMNDASGRRPPEEFARIIRETKQRIQTARPECDVLLVSSMTANPEWSYAEPELYPAYAAALQKLAGPGCAVADVTAIWTAVLQHKPYLCLSGNGLNHPNDFGHRLYAEVVLAVVGKP